MENTIKDEIMLRLINYMKNNDSSELFYWMIPKIIELENEYDESMNDYAFSVILSQKHGIDNCNESQLLYCKYENIGQNIDTLKEILLGLKLDSTMQIYFNLYAERRELSKEFWKCTAEKDVITPGKLFKFITDPQIEKKIDDERNDLDNRIKLLKCKIENIDNVMNEIYHK